MIQFFTKRMKNRKGFTLIELIVVIAILGILALIAVPRLGAFRDDAEESANLATARTILSAATLAEANDGDLTQTTLEQYVDLTVTVSSDPGAAGGGWHVRTSDPLVVYLDDEPILP